MKKNGVKTVNVQFWTLIGNWTKFYSSADSKVQPLWCHVLHIVTELFVPPAAWVHTEIQQLFCPANSTNQCWYNWYLKQFLHVTNLRHLLKFSLAWGLSICAKCLYNLSEVIRLITVWGQTRPHDYGYYGYLMIMKVWWCKQWLHDSNWEQYMIIYFLIHVKSIIT